MDCTNAQLLLVFYRPDRPDDLLAEDAASLQAHLAQCPNCAAQLSRRSAQDRAIAESMREVTVPSQLAGRLQDRATAQLRSQWRRTAAKFALAATVLLALYGGYVAATRPYLDVERLAELEDSIWQAPEGSTSNWLAANGLPTALSDDFDWQLATFHGRRDVQGIPTYAVRLDSNSRQRAWIYFVRGREFNLTNAATGQWTSNVAVRVYRDRPGGWTAVVVYTGNNLNAFLRSPIEKA